MGQEEPETTVTPASHLEPESPSPDPELKPEPEPMPISRRELERELECPLCGGLWFKGRCRDCGAYHNGSEIVKRDTKPREEPSVKPKQDEAEPETEQDEEEAEKTSSLDSWIG